MDELTDAEAERSTGLGSTPSDPVTIGDADPASAEPEPFRPDGSKHGLGRHLGTFHIDEQSGTIRYEKHR